MDLRISLACKKAINLCNYMLHQQNDEYVRNRRLKINSLMTENKNQESAIVAKEVSSYIQKHFDNIVGENVILEIDRLLKESS